MSTTDFRCYTTKDTKVYYPYLAEYKNPFLHMHTMNIFQGHIISYINNKYLEEIKWKYNKLFKIINGKFYIRLTAKYIKDLLRITTEKSVYNTMKQLREVGLLESKKFENGNFYAFANKSMQDEFLKDKGLDDEVNDLINIIKNHGFKIDTEGFPVEGNGQDNNAEGYPPTGKPVSSYGEVYKGNSSSTSKSNYIYIGKNFCLELIEEYNASANDLGLPLKENSLDIEEFCMMFIRKYHQSKIPPETFVNALKNYFKVMELPSTYYSNKWTLEQFFGLRNNKERWFNFKSDQFVLENYIKKDNAFNKKTVKDEQKKKSNDFFKQMEEREKQKEKERLEIEEKEKQYRLNALREEEQEQKRIKELNKNKSVENFALDFMKKINIV